MSGASRPSKKALLAVARFASVFSAPGFSAGQWDSGPYFKASAAVSEFVHAVYEHGIIPKDFNWTDWVSIGELLEADTARLPSADLETIRRLLTCHFRRERFCEGSLASAIGDGRIGRLLSRLAVLASSKARRG